MVITSREEVVGVKDAIKCYFSKQHHALIDLIFETNLECHEFLNGKEFRSYASKVLALYAFRGKKIVNRAIIAKEHFLAGYRDDAVDALQRLFLHTVTHQDVALVADIEDIYDQHKLNPISLLQHLLL